MSLLEIAGDDIAKLDDSALRELIGLLCEADFRRAGLSTAGVTWGGDQNAADGGFDVVVDTNDDPPKDSFVQRSRTGFQVKKPDMPASEIAKEMRPDNALREGIKNLIRISGSYVIVSSSGSTAASALDRRRAAMRAAVENEAGHANLHIDFFDRGRLATWVRSHQSLIL